MTTDYDLLIIGGGIAGASLGRAMALAGQRVLIVEQETQFKDRVRGEAIHPWGMAEARQLGLDRLLRSTCGHELPYSVNHWGGIPLGLRDLRRTSPEGVGTLAFFHPAMQECLLAAAAESGVEVRRGVRATQVRPGQPAEVTLQADGKAEILTARLVVGADGRKSRVRDWAGLKTRFDPERLTVASVLLENLSMPEDRFHVMFPAAFGEMLLIFPIGQRRFRVYFVYQKLLRDRKLSGAAKLPELIRACVEMGAPRRWFRQAQAIGPLAAFDAADTFVEHPCAEGVVVIGDAARSNDPSWGSGLSLALRDVRVLRDELLANADWPAAVTRFAARHEEYYSSIHRVESWLQRLFFDRGTAADAARALALPSMVFGGGPDLIGLGADSPSDESARLLLFGDGQRLRWLAWLAGPARGMAIIAWLVELPGAAKTLSCIGWCVAKTLEQFRRPKKSVESFRTQADQTAAGERGSAAEDPSAVAESTSISPSA